MGEAVAVVLLLLVLGFAVIRPRGWPEVVVAVPAAVLLVVTGAISLPHAGAEVARLAPVVGFLAAVLVLAQLCDDEGLFRDAGALMARVCRGRPRRLLLVVFVIASATTAVLSLDATVVLLTPVVFATAVRVGARPAPHAYACTHLANTASLLLPVSNLTNLLAFAASGLTFTRFATLMALPWLAAIAVEYVVFRRFFATDLDAGTAIPPSSEKSGPPKQSEAFRGHVGAAEAPVQGDGEAVDDGAERGAESSEEPDEPVVPGFVLIVVGCTLAGFVLTSLVGINPAWAAFAGAVVLAVRALARRRTTVRGLVRAANAPFLAFVLALGIVVRAVVDNGLAAAVGHFIPTGTTLPALLGMAAVAAVLANVINNLPAVLVLLPLAAMAGPGMVLATLIGANIGPNLTYVGSLATLLWRRVLHEHDTDTDLAEFTRLGLLTVPAALVVAVLGLWAGLNLIGG